MHLFTRQMRYFIRSVHINLYILNKWNQFYLLFIPGKQPFQHRRSHMESVLQPRAEKIIYYPLGSGVKHPETDILQSF